MEGRKEGRKGERGKEGKGGKREEKSRWGRREGKKGRKKEERKEITFLLISPSIIITENKWNECVNRSNYQDA